MPIYHWLLADVLGFALKADIISMFQLDDAFMVLAMVRKIIPFALNSALSATATVAKDKAEKSAATSKSPAPAVTPALAAPPAQARSLSGYYWNGDPTCQLCKDDSHDE